MDEGDREIFHPMCGEITFACSHRHTVLLPGLSVSSLGFQWDQNSTGDYSHASIQMLELSSVTAGTIPRPGLSDRGTIACRPSVTGELKVNVNAEVENSESQAATNHLLRSISACALPPA